MSSTLDQMIRMKNVDKKDVCVVHLVWVPLGLEPLKRFLKAYNLYRAGMDHDLLVVFNGFKHEKELEIYKQTLIGFKHNIFLIWKSNFDVQSYFTVVQRHTYDYFCFLNSYSRVQAHDWLLKMYTHIVKPGVGIVGATGSWESMYTNFLNGMEDIKDISLIKRMIRQWKQKIKKSKKKSRFDPFPNYHIRTNGFMISRDIMRKIRCGFISRKTHAYKFESGKNSITRQVAHMGLKALVVGKDGKAYEDKYWYRAETFRQGNQGNLLIADNQTDAYAKADPETKWILSRRSWGEYADTGISKEMAAYDNR